MNEWVGRTLSKVEIERLLGRGGMADVYLGRHNTLNRPVAVKILHSHLTDDASLLARFRAEAQAVAAMRHPHIVQVLDFDIVEGRPYIVMELLEGLSLKDYLTEVRYLGVPIEPGTIGFLITSLSSALDYAHARGIVHRDIKPANVMLRRDGPIEVAEYLPQDVEVVLTDFGIARIADAGVQTVSGVIVGTPQYMSPEQVRGEAVDARSDIYALGIMLYEMLSGRLPFDGDTQASILIKHISEPPPTIPGLPKEVQGVVDRALAKDPMRRFQKASDLAAALSDALEHIPSGTNEPFTIPAGSSPLTDDALATKQLDALEPSIETGVAGQPQSPQTPSGGQQTATAPRRMPLILFGAAGLAILILSMLFLNRPDSPQTGDVTHEPTTEETDSPTDAPSTTEATESPLESSAEPSEAAVIPTVDASQPVGYILINNSGVSINLQGLADLPEGTVYEAWLTGPELEPLSLGVFNTQSQVTTVRTDSRALLNTYSGFVITTEAADDDDSAMSGNVLYQGSIPDEHLAYLRLMFEVEPSVTLKEGILQGASEQAETYDSHVNNTINAVAANNTSEAVTHAEHVINIVVGRNSPEYGDYNGNTRAENPGNGVGLAVYLALLQQTALGAAQSPDADSDTVEAANAIDTSVSDILVMITSAKEKEASITAADSIDEMSGLTEDLQSLFVVDVVNAVIAQAVDLDLSVAIPVFLAGS